MKTVTKKILIILLIILINFNFIFPSFVYCGDIGVDDGPPLSPEEAVEEDEEVPEEPVEEEEPGELVVAGEDDGPPLSPEEAVEEEEEVAVEAADAMSADSATTTLDIAIIWLGNRFVEIMVNQGDNAKDYFSALLTTFRRAGEVRN